MVRLHRFLLSFKFLDALLEGFNASFHVLVHLLAVAVVDVTCPLLFHRLSSGTDYRSVAAGQSIARKCHGTFQWSDEK